jgi:hypothetical protein
MVFTRLADCLARYLYMRSPLSAMVAELVGNSSRDTPVVLMSKGDDGEVHCRSFIVGDTFRPFGYTVVCPNAASTPGNHLLQSGARTAGVSYRLRCPQCRLRLQRFDRPSSFKLHPPNVFEADFPHVLPEQLVWEPLQDRPARAVGESSQEAHARGSGTAGGEGSLGVLAERRQSVPDLSGILAGAAELAAPKHGLKRKQAFSNALPNVSGKRRG